MWEGLEPWRVEGETLREERKQQIKIGNQREHNLGKERPEDRDGEVEIRIEKDGTQTTKGKSTITESGPL